MGKKIRIAFIKFAGLSAGGTEKFLQVLAANLPKEKFSLDYFYCDAAPYTNENFNHVDTDPERIKFMEENHINLIKFNVKYKDTNSTIHKWIDTDFFEKFDEKNYDLIQTGRAGYPEYPFTEIKKTPIVDSLHLSVKQVDNQFNIARVLHISKWSAGQWIKKGGDKKRIEVISTFIDRPNPDVKSMREELGLSNKMVFGFHQRKDDWIYSPIPLDAYKKIEDENTHFLLLNGSDLYKKQAEELGIKSITFLPYAETQEDIYSFIKTLDVFAHGRKDGEVNSAAMAEAMFFGLPIVSHTSEYSNGHIEAIGDAGAVVNTVEEYVMELNKLKNDSQHYKALSTKAKSRFEERYGLENQINRIVGIYEDVIMNPFPNKLRRILFNLKNRVEKIFYNKYTRNIYRKLWKKQK